MHIVVVVILVSSRLVSSQFVVVIVIVVVIVNQSCAASIDLQIGIIISPRKRWRYMNMSSQFSSASMAS